VFYIVRVNQYNCIVASLKVEYITPWLKNVYNVANRQQLRWNFSHRPPFLNLYFLHDFSIHEQIQSVSNLRSFSMIVIENGSEDEEHIQYEELVKIFKLEENLLYIT
jgi:hypothetical protein